MAGNQITSGMITNVITILVIIGGGVIGFTNLQNKTAEIEKDVENKASIQSLNEVKREFKREQESVRARLDIAEQSRNEIKQLNETMIKFMSRVDTILELKGLSKRENN
jgi:predicted PurR-regulated permease PerM